MPKSKQRNRAPVVRSSPLTSPSVARRRYEPTPEPELKATKKRSKKEMPSIKTPSVKEEQCTVDGIITPPIATTPAIASAASGDVTKAVVHAQAYITPAKSASPVMNTAAKSELDSRKRKRGSDRPQEASLREENYHSSYLRTTREQIFQVRQPVPKTPVDHRSLTPDANFIEADTFDELPVGTILRDRYRITKVFGRGNFSICYGAFDQEDKREVAIKRFHHEWFGIGIHEAALLDQFKCSSRIVNSFEPFWAGGNGDDEHYHIVMEALRGDSQLALPACNCIDPRHKPIGCPMRHRALAKIMAQLLSGLAELHHQGVIHGDLTPSNILQSRRHPMDIKLIDLSNAIKKEDRRNYENVYEVQTACYRAPEMLLGSGPLGKHIDVWSVGIIALELLFGNDVVIPGGIEGAELLRSPVDGRDALVRRLIAVFGSIRACKGGKFWQDAYGGLSARWGWQKGHGKVELGDNVGALPEVLEATANPRLKEFLKGLLEVDYTQRLSVDSALRDPWLVGTLLGEWGNVLINPGWCEDEEEGEEEQRRVRPRIDTPPSTKVRSPAAQSPPMPPPPPLAGSPLPPVPDHRGEDWMNGEDGVDMDEDGYEDDEEEELYEDEDEVNLVE